jgi:hypothetical protein
VRHGRCTARIGELRETAGLQATLGADAERVSLAAQDVPGNQVTNHGVEEILFAVDQDVFDCAQREGALLERAGGGAVDAARVDR